MSRDEHVETPFPSTILLKKDHAFIPSLTEIISFLTVSLVALSVTTILPIVRAREDGAYQFITDSLGNFVGEKLAELSGTRWATFMTALIWMLIGMGLYLAIWAIMVIVHAYKNDIPPLKGFVVPDSYAKKSNAVNIAAHILARSFGLISLVAWIILLLGFIFPQSAKLFIDALIEINGLSIVRILGALLLLAFSLYVITILLRIVTLKRRVFGS